MQGAGDSQTGGGLGTYKFDYNPSNNSPGVNSWAMNTVVTNPDNSTDTVYTDAYALVMLDDHYDPASGLDTIEFYVYNDQGQLILDAAPSAVSGYNEAYADLLDNVDGEYQDLDDNIGLITRYTYSTTTTATETTAGGVAGYEEDVQIQQGQQGTLIPQETWKYYAHAFDGQTIAPVATDTVYGGTGSSDPRETTSAYTWYALTAQIQSETDNAPVISAAENGPGTADVTTTFFDPYGNAQWIKDPDGYIQYNAFDLATGALVTSLIDVDQTMSSVYTNPPPGLTIPVSGHLNLLTQYQVDALGRTTKETSPNGNITYYVYLDPQREERVYQGWNSDTNTPTGPTQVIREDATGSYTETLTMSATPNLTNGAPDGTEDISDLQSLTRDYTNDAGQVIAEDSYFNLSGLTYMVGVMGLLNTNYYKTQYSYDNRGRQSQMTTANGTIYQTDFDSLGRTVDTQVGTSSSNMVKTADYVYDNNTLGGQTQVGDGNLTQLIEHPGGGAPDRVTQNWYDWRDRQVATKAGVQSTEDTSTHRPIVVTTYDNLDEVTETQQYDGDGVTPQIVNGVLQALDPTRLRAQEKDYYDDQGQEYQTQTFSVDPSNGTVAPVQLTTNDYYDLRGDLIAEAQPGGLWQKSQFDGAGRDVMDSTTDGGGHTDWAAANSVANDTVLEQVQTVYDGDDNPIETIDSQRFDNATSPGPLNSTNARTYYAAAYYDRADRLIADVNAGTNGGAAWMRPSTVPNRSDSPLLEITSYGYAADSVQQVSLNPGTSGGTFTLSFNGQTTQPLAYNATPLDVQTALQGLSSIGTGNVLVSGMAGAWVVRFTNGLAGQYENALSGDGSQLTGGPSPGLTVSETSVGGDDGQQQQVTDPLGLIAETDDDALGRAVRTIENFNPNDATLTSSSNVTTEYGYDGDGHQVLVQADEPGGAVEKTQYVYEVNTGSTGLGDNSAINSNDILGGVEYPDPNTGQPSTVATQEENDAVDALGETIQATDRNGNVHQYTLDVLGRVTSDTVKTLGANVDGSVRRIDYGYDSQGNLALITSYDAPTGGNIVNQVQDVFNGLGQLTDEYQSHSGAVVPGTTPQVQYDYTEIQDTSRLTSMTYPSNNYTVNYNYNAGLDSNISRLSSLSETVGGVTTPLESYKYLGLDTVVERDHPQNGVNLTYIARGQTGDAGDQYVGLDRFGRVIDQNWVNSTTQVSTDDFAYGYNQDSDVLYRQNLVDSTMTHDELYGYDPLNQLTSFQRGTLNATHDGIVVGTQTRSQSWSPDALGNFTTVTTDGTPENRTVNQQNEYTATGSGTPSYDNNGNLTADGSGNTYVYDAWNRLVKVQNGGTTLAAYGYDGLGHRITETHDNGNTVTDLYYSANWQVLEERVNGQLQARYVWSPVGVDTQVLRDDSSQGNGTLDRRLYVQQDANGNVTALVNVNGTVVERYDYDPFGAVTVLNPDFSVLNVSNYGWLYFFQGKRYDGAVGLYDSRERVYSPTLMRPLQTDPMGQAAGVNLYDWEGNGPTGATDPTGQYILAASKSIAEKMQEKLQAWWQIPSKPQSLPGSNRWYLYVPYTAAYRVYGLRDKAKSDYDRSLLMAALSPSWNVEVMNDDLGLYWTQDTIARHPEAGGESAGLTAEELGGIRTALIANSLNGGRTGAEQYALTEINSQLSQMKGWSFYKWLYTGSGYTPDEIYEATMLEGGEYQYQHSPFRGVYGFVGVEGKYGEVLGLGGYDIGNGPWAGGLVATPYPPGMIEHPGLSGGYEWTTQESTPIVLIDPGADFPYGAGAFFAKEDFGIYGSGHLGHFGVWGVGVYFSYENFPNYFNGDYWTGKLPPK